MPKPKSKMGKAIMQGPSDVQMMGMSHEKSPKQAPKAPSAPVRSKAGAKKAYFGKGG